VGADNDAGLTGSGITGKPADHVAASMPFPDDVDGRAQHHSGNVESWRGLAAIQRFLQVPQRPVHRPQQRLGGPVGNRNGNQTVIRGDTAEDRPD